MNVVLLFGGVGEEYEISLRSAAAVVSAFPKKHRLTLVGIDRDGGWYHTLASAKAIAADAWQTGASPVLLDPCRRALLSDGTPLCADVVFPLLHGGLYEGGGAAALLSILSLPYVGCPMTAGALAMDKILVKRLAAAEGIPVAPFSAVTERDLADSTLPDRLETALGYPMFVKPAASGSSVGVSRVTGRDDLLPALTEALRFGGVALCEEMITGAEVELALLRHDDRLLASTVGEIESGAAFYDYNAKYRTHTSRIFIPARIPRAAVERVTAYGCRLFDLLGCRGLSRIDFFVRPDGEVILNEVNTMPGFTDISMFPRLWQAAGVSMEELIDILLKNASL